MGATRHRHECRCGTQDCVRHISGMTRRELLAACAPSIAAGQKGKAPIVNAAEHAWVTHDPRYAIEPGTATCPANLPNYDYSAEFLLSEMRTYKVDQVVVSHVC